ncbi:MAG TPA: DNA/RNA non-specific endonuclease [Phycisphaerae bacterium]|nr:DNA/RNA non-specific endonuclease [Phycisphaerae bacterium]
MINSSGKSAYDELFSENPLQDGQRVKKSSRPCARSAEGDFGSGHMYRYVGNDPTNAVDPTGMDAVFGSGQSGGGFGALQAMPVNLSPHYDTPITAGTALPAYPGEVSFSPNSPTASTEVLSAPSAPAISNFDQGLLDSTEYVYDNAASAPSVVASPSVIANPYAPVRYATGAVVQQNLNGAWRVSSDGTSGTLTLSSGEAYQFKNPSNVGWIMTTPIDQVQPLQNLALLNMPLGKPIYYSSDNWRNDLENADLPTLAATLAYYQSETTKSIIAEDGNAESNALNVEDVQKQISIYQGASFDWGYSSTEQWIAHSTLDDAEYLQPFLGKQVVRQTQYASAVLGALGFQTSPPPSSQADIDARLTNAGVTSPSQSSLVYWAGPQGDNTGMAFNLMGAAAPIFGLNPIDPAGRGINESYTLGEGNAPSTTGLQARFTQGSQGELQSAFANIEPGDIGNGTPTTVAARDLAQSLGNATDDAGHAIGNNLGGPGDADSGNIFPQDPSVNRGAYRQFEQQIAGRVQNGDQVYVRVVPQYTPGATRPSQIVYQVRINGVTTTRVFPNQ